MLSAQGVVETKIRAWPDLYGCFDDLLVIGTSCPSTTRAPDLCYLPA